MTYVISDDMYETLKQLAEKSCIDNDEDFNPMDASGGNFDDAYNMGISDGEHDARIELASTVLRSIIEI
jgi:hypothetical protein